jgi:hypothetical protein
MAASIIATASIILATALSSGKPCETVFKDLTYEAFPAVKAANEQAYMNKLSVAACETANPDIIWQIVSIETGFRFKIVRINSSEEVLQGEDAVAYLEELQMSAEAMNVDVGVMQFNWYWHGRNFAKDPVKMLDPARQVAYLNHVFAPALKKQCGDAWIGCYHNAANKQRAKSYEALINKSRRILDQHAKEYRKNNQSLPFRALS